MLGFSQDSYRLVLAWAVSTTLVLTVNARTGAAAISNNLCFANTTFFVFLLLSVPLLCALPASTTKMHNGAWAPKSNRSNGRTCYQSIGRSKVRSGTKKGLRLPWEAIVIPAHGPPRRLILGNLSYSRIPYG